MDIERIEELIKTLEASTAQEITVRKGAFSVHVKRGSKPARRKARAVEESVTVDRKQKNEQFITAPMVGIFHAADDLTEPGARVTSGQVVGAIESMKLLNDVVSPFTGVIREVLVEDGAPVEYGQPLYRIEVEES